MSIRQLIPNLFTAGNLVGGILAIIFTLNGKIHLAPYCILIAALFDFVDGFIARKLKVDGPLGKQLDSLADMVTFGVAPGIMVYEMIKSHAVVQFFIDNEIWDNNPYISWPVASDYNCNFLDALPKSEIFYHFCEDPVYLYLPYIAFLIPICALFRLAKFNLDDSQTNSFKGLPTPAATIFIAALPLIIVDGMNPTLTWKFDLVNNFLYQPITLAIISVVFSILMLLKFQMFSLKFKSFGWKGNEMRYIFLTISAVLLATLFWWGLPIIIVLYIVLSLINNITSKNEIQS